MEATIITEQITFKGKVIPYGINSLAIIIPVALHSKVEQFQTPGVKVELHISDSKHKPATIEYMAKVSTKGKHEKVLVIPIKFKKLVSAFTGKHMEADIRLLLSVAKW